MRKLALAVVCFSLVLSFDAGLAFAGKAQASIDAPQTAQKGSEVTIKVTATHNANSALHYTQWLKITVNQKEVARWEFSSGKRPEGEVFTREVKLKAVENMDVAVEASCNMHGQRRARDSKDISW